MKKSYTLLLLFTCLISFGQQRNISINWDGHKNLDAGYAKITVPSFDNDHFSYDQINGLRYFIQWNELGLINETNASITNVSYSVISSSDLKDVNRSTIPTEIKFRIANVDGRGKKGVYFEISPIIKDGNSYRRINSFTLNYSIGAERQISNNSQFSNITNSVLANGNWYRFYVDTTGVHRLT